MRLKREYRARTWNGVRSISLGSSEYLIQSSPERPRGRKEGRQIDWSLFGSLLSGFASGYGRWPCDGQRENDRGTSS